VGISARARKLPHHIQVVTQNDIQDLPVGLTLAGTMPSLERGVIWIRAEKRVRFRGGCCWP
jgi:hypothetical protein